MTSAISSISWISTLKYLFLEEVALTNLKQQNNGWLNHSPNSLEKVEAISASKPTIFVVFSFLLANLMQVPLKHFKTLQLFMILRSIEELSLSSCGWMLQLKVNGDNSWVIRMLINLSSLCLEKERDLPLTKDKLPRILSEAVSKKS